jgi:hypothetical protein
MKFETTRNKLENIWNEALRNQIKAENQKYTNEQIEEYINQLNNNPYLFNKIFDFSSNWTIPTIVRTGYYVLDTAYYQWEKELILDFRLIPFISSQIIFTFNNPDIQDQNGNTRFENPFLGLNTFGHFSEGVYGRGENNKYYIINISDINSYNQYMKKVIIRDGFYIENKEVGGGTQHYPSQTPLPLPSFWAKRILKLNNPLRYY